MTKTTTSAGTSKPARSKFTIGRTLVGIVIISWLGFWIWAFAFASPSNPNELDTVGYGTTSQTLCEAANASIDAMPSARDASTPLERAGQVRASTMVVEEMVASLHASADEVVIAHDTELLTKWLDDYDAYVTDRWRYVKKLEGADGSESPKDLAFTLTQRVSGGVYTSRIDAFARANDMPSCQVPGDA